MPASRRSVKGTLDADDCRKHRADQKVRRQRARSVGIFLLPFAGS